METIKLNITQINTLVKRIIDAEEFLQNISVYGEVSNYKISAGNAYFDIKEAGAQLACIQFGAYNSEIKNGDMVLLTGRLNYYVKTGKLSFIASRIEPYGLGDLYKQYLELKQRLSDEGLFDDSRKKQIPRYAQKVGVVTSETGAVIRDIVHVAKKKNPFADIVVYPARVQGSGAENEIIAGLDYFENSDVDVVIIARGGGSFEDMAPFNTEKLARKIFSCKKPIISAVGHETDFSLSDFVADTRAPTPSVAAEIAFFDYAQTKDELKFVLDNIASVVASVVTNCRQKIVDISQDNLQILFSLTAQKRAELSGTINAIGSNYQLQTKTKRAELDKTLAIIDTLSPLKLLKNGYSLVEKGGKRVVDIDQISVGDRVSVTLNDGNFDATVTKKEKK